MQLHCWGGANYKIRALGTAIVRAGKWICCFWGGVENERRLSVRRLNERRDKKTRKRDDEVVKTGVRLRSAPDKARSFKLVYMAKRLLQVCVLDVF